jgi:hypothetical protein
MWFNNVFYGCRFDFTVTYPFGNQNIVRTYLYAEMLLSIFDAIALTTVGIIYLDLPLLGLSVLLVVALTRVPPPNTIRHRAFVSHAHHLGFGCGDIVSVFLNIKLL